MELCCMFTAISAAGLSSLPPALSGTQVFLEHDDASSCSGGTSSPQPNGSHTGPQQPPALLFRQAMAHMDLWLLRRQLRLMQPTSATPLMLTATMQMLGAAATKAAALADDGYDMSAFTAACLAAEKHLRALAGERALQAARPYELPDAESPALLGTNSPPAGVLPEVLAPRVEENGLVAAQQRAARNLGSLSLLPDGAPAGALASFGQTLAFVSLPQCTNCSSDVAAQLVLRSVERELFKRAALGFDDLAN